MYVGDSFLNCFAIQSAVGQGLAPSFIRLGFQNPNLKSSANRRCTTSANIFGFCKAKWLRKVPFFR